MWNCCLPSEPSSSVPLHPSRSVYLVSQLKRGCYVSFRELILSCSIFEKIDPSRVSFSPCQVSWSSQNKTTRQIWWRINVLTKCNLNREDCVSLRFPFILPYAWISGRDSWLVGVSCHSPRSALICFCFSIHATCLNFMKFEMGIAQALAPKHCK